MQYSIMRSCHSLYFRIIRALACARRKYRQSRNFFPEGESQIRARNMTFESQNVLLLPDIIVTVQIP